LKRITSGSWSARLARLLLSQHSTPDPRSNLSPAELLMKRKLKTCLDRILPNNAEIAKRKVTPPPHREFKVDDHVFVRSYNQQKKWEKAKIVKRIGRLLYIVRTEIGLIWKRH
ncbi:hypothetical protein T08_5743, partial [Trichinella sp. T8]